MARRKGRLIIFYLSSSEKSLDQSNKRLVEKRVEYYFMNMNYNTNNYTYIHIYYWLIVFRYTYSCKLQRS